jgi:hypothetical protein
LSFESLLRYDARRGPVERAADGVKAQQFGMALAREASADAYHPGTVKVSSRHCSRLVACQQQCDRARAKTREGLIGAARQNDRYARAKYDARDLRLGQVFEFLREHVTGLEIRNHKNVSPASHWRVDPFGLRRPLRDGAVEGERTVEDATANLTAVSHLAKRRSIEGRPDFSVTVSTAERIATLGSAMLRACARSIAF